MAVVLAGLFLVQDAGACAVCYGDPESPLTKGLEKGVLVLVGVIYTVLGAMAVIQTDRGDEMFMAMCSRACQAIRDLESDQLI